MLGTKVKSVVKCHLFTPPRHPGEPAPAAEKNPRGNTGFYYKYAEIYSLLLLLLLLLFFCIFLTLGAAEKHFCFHPSIHPFLSAYPGPGRGGSCLSRDTQTSLSPDTSSSSSGRIPRRSQSLPRGLLPAGHARNTS